ncbi:hypothetical protein [Gloeobacter morelensis]|uniref:Uncharacterized protein n=1 Tax=Gloeobacter morelensis MG652769 TaxID=2781736 RepID=A0ABY3PLT3_9CYAN|nr:hypothetical protein [Gloeobacter morelensis]UFP94667.1 hypothetical protein ISF26_23565 [Gloeobacter morelensis MG652769]
MAGLSAAAESIPATARSCLAPDTDHLSVDARARADRAGEYWIIGSTEGEGGGQYLVLLKSGRCKLLGADNVVWPLSRWGLREPQARALALDWARREVASQPDGLKALQRQIDRSPAHQLEWLAPEQKWAYKQLGIRF